MGNTVSKTNEKPDVEAIMAEIRKRVKDDANTRAKDGKSVVAHYRSPAANANNGEISPLLYSEELNYLNANWDFNQGEEEVTSHRPIIGPVIVKVKRLLSGFIRNSVLKRYTEKEKTFHAELVRHLNQTARYVDARDRTLFWQLVDKLDNDVKALNLRSDRLYETHSASTDKRIYELEKRISKLEK